MRLRVEFGPSDYKEIVWSGELMDFPRIIRFYSSNYEWVMYDDDKTKKNDYILIFSKLGPSNPSFGKQVRSWEELFGNGGYVCECGARHTSFPQLHMQMCKLWRPWQ